MDFASWIGFIISVLALLYLFLKPSMESRERKKNPQEYDRRKREDERRLKELMHPFDLDVEEEELEIRPIVQKKVKPPKPPVKPTKATESIHIYHPTKNMAPQINRMRKMLKHPKNAILLREILGPPKAAQSIRHHESWD